MLYLSVSSQSNPAIVSAGTTITGSSGVYNGDAVYGRYYPWTLINYGALQAVGATSFGVDLEDGGKVVNGRNGPVVGSITGGYDGVVFRGAAGTLVNQGTISTTGSNGGAAYFGAGGTVTNGASGATAALISGADAGIVFAGAPGTVTNFGQIEERTTTIDI